MSLCLCPVSPHEFDAVYAAMEEDFVIEERRDYKDALSVMENKQYCLYHVLENDTRVGFISVWELSETAYVEHFVTYTPYRGRGLGSRVLTLLKERYPHILLEAEHPEDEMKARRLAFYGRNGFCKNDYPYHQPSYRVGGKGIDLVLLSYPAPLANAARTVTELYRTVYGKEE